MGHDAATTPALLAGAGTASADTHRDDQPTLTVSSPECETLRLDYGDRGPPISVDVSGPDAFTTALDRGEQVDREVVPGSYGVTARPAESDVDRVITVEGSPIEVEPCGIIARLDCSRENPLDHTVWIRYRRKYVHDGWWISGWLELPAGGTVDQSGDASTYHHYYQAKTERSDGGGDILVPINGSTAPLVIDQPCEEITLR